MFFFRVVKPTGRVIIFMNRETQIKEEEAQRIAKNLVDTLAVQFISDRTGVDIAKVKEFRREHEMASRK